MSRAEESTLDSGAPAHGTPPPRSCICRFWTKYMDVDDAWLKEIRGHLITAATLTATMAYQSILSPPGSFWQETSHGATAPSSDRAHDAGQAVWDTKKSSFKAFVTLNTLQLGASLSTVMLAVAGFPLRNKFLTWLLVISVYVTVGCMAVAHMIAVNFVSQEQFPLGAIIALISGGGLVCIFITVLHFVRFLVWLYGKVKSPGGCCCFSSPTSRPNQNSIGNGKGNTADRHWRTPTAT